MEPVAIFSSKAEKYARYRWDYAPEAIRRIFELTRIGSQTVVADIGAGTGILTRHFTGHCRMVYAVEPNGPMRALLERELADQTGWQALGGRAEATGLPECSVDLVTVAQALNWFDPLPAREEFRRILKPGGWLAAIRNVGSYGVELDTALEGVYPQELDATASMIGRGAELSFYYGSHDFLQESYPFSKTETWDVFFGSLATASCAPDEGSTLYTQFEQATRAAFERFSRGGAVVAQVETKLCLGRIQLASCV